MNKHKFTPIDIDADFDDVQFDEQSINYSTAAKLRMQNPQTRKRLSKSISEKQNNPEYLAHMSRQRLEAMDQINNDKGQTLREILTEANRKSAANPEHHANRTAANRKLKTDKNWQEAHAKGVLNYSEETMTPMGIYCSMSQWMKEHNKPGGRSFFGSLPHLFYQIKNGPGEPTFERIYYTPYGKCASPQHAYNLSISNNEPNAQKLRNISGWYLKMATLYPDHYYIKFEKAKYWPSEKEKLYGIEELEKHPRLTKEKMLIAKEKWRLRLIHHRKLYKQDLKDS